MALKGETPIHHLIVHRVLRLGKIQNLRLFQVAVATAIALFVVPVDSASAASNAVREATSAVVADLLPNDASQLLERIRATHDNQQLPFAIVDKKTASVHLFDATGVRTGSSSILLRLARGDDSAPGIGQREISHIRPFERTTPAGRFKTEPGRNMTGEDIVWVDYDAAISMHRVRPANKADRRLERLTTPGASDKRISYGCINVPASFYDAHIRPTLGVGDGVVYVLPETRSVDAQFGRLLAPAR